MHSLFNCFKYQTFFYKLYINIFQIELYFSYIRYVISVSNKFLTWDLATSEVCRDVDPHIEGLMLGLSLR